MQGSTYHGLTPRLRGRLHTPAQTRTQPASPESRPVWSPRVTSAPGSRPPQSHVRPRVTSAPESRPVPVSRHTVPSATARSPLTIST
jgi:hypothetical protein